MMAPRDTMALADLLLQGQKLVAAWDTEMQQSVATSARSVTLSQPVRQLQYK